MDKKTFKIAIITVVALGLISFVCLIAVFALGLTYRWSGPGLQSTLAPTVEVAWAVHPNSDKIPVWSAPMPNAADVMYIEYGDEIEVLGRVSNEHGEFCYIRFRSWTGYIEAQYVSETELPQATSSPTWTLTSTPARTSTPTVTKKLLRTPTPIPVAKTVTRLDNDLEEEAIRLALIAGGITVHTVGIVDARATGGERSVIIAIIVSNNSTIEAAVTLSYVFDAVYGVDSVSPADLDYINVIMGNAAGQAIGAVSVSMYNVEAWQKGRMSTERFVASWDIIDYTEQW